MDLATKYFLTCLVLFVALGVGGYQYHIQTITSLQTDYNARFVDVNSRIADQSQNLAELNSAVADQGITLATKISEVEKTSQADLKELTGELGRVESESAGKIAGIKSELLQIDVETKGFTSIIDRVRDSVVSLRTNTGYGSGVVVGRDALTIVFANGKHYPGRIAGFDKKADLALLKIGDTGRFVPLDFARYNSMAVGQKVIAMGSPAGLDFTVTEGIVSSLDRKNTYGIDMIQSSVPINPGNSGGPLIDGTGLIVGINTYKVTGTEGLGFAMNPDTAKSFVSSTIKADEKKIAEAEAQ